MRPHPLILCGQGRIGSKVYQHLKSQGEDLQLAKIDEEKGLLVADEPLTGIIQTLVICIAPGKTEQAAGLLPRWTWDRILSGLERQVLERKLSVERIIFIGSTRVYDCQERGIIDAASSAVGKSRKARQLLSAELQLARIGVHCRIMRCAGLYGEQYPVYWPILKAADDRPRFGVDSNRVVERIIELTRLTDWQSGIELLTDGRVYFQGRSENLGLDKISEKIRLLSREFKLLVNSRT